MGEVGSVTTMFKAVDANDDRTDTGREVPSAEAFGDTTDRVLPKWGVFGCHLLK